jgi:hypothetical protein
MDQICAGKHNGPRSVGEVDIPDHQIRRLPPGSSDPNLHLDFLSRHHREPLLVGKLVLHRSRDIEVNQIEPHHRLRGAT